MLIFMIQSLWWVHLIFSELFKVNPHFSCKMSHFIHITDMGIAVLFNSLRTCLFIPSEMLTFLVAFTSSDAAILKYLSKVGVMSVGSIVKFSIKIVKVPFQNNKNWASYKFLARKSEKMCLSKNFTKLWDVEFQKWHFLCSYVPEFHIHVSIHGNNTFPGVQISKSVGMCLSLAKEKYSNIQYSLSFKKKKKKKKQMYSQQNKGHIFSDKS